jgi:3,4-dihydroxy-9,10-secoandrosta-1,3,5(10)-triene-9,17-dione 4,5-dioxygenase
MNIRSLAYVGYGAPDPSQWLEYGTQILGLMPARALPGESWGMPMDPTSGPASAGSGVAEDGSVYLKMDDWQWRIGLHPHATNAGLLYLGLEVKNQVALEKAVKELEGLGIEVRMGSAEEAASRAVAALAITHDPLGHQVELFYGPTVDKNYQSPQGMQFKTGELGLGHLNLLAGPLDDAQEFYSRVLGFELTDFMHFGPMGSVHFYHCNPRHHSIGLLHMGEVSGIQHMMLEVTEVDMMLQCLERVQDAGINVTSSVGRHINDNTLSFYMSSPFGFEVEIGFDGLVLEDDWVANQFVGGDIWGHRGLDPETIEANLASLKAKQGIES